MPNASTDSDRKRDAFFGWLAQQPSSAQISELNEAMAYLDRYCTDKRLISEPLCSITDSVQINRLRVKLEGDRLFKFFNRGKTEKMLSALKQYKQYLEQSSIATPLSSPASASVESAMHEMPAVDTAAVPTDDSSDKEPMPAKTTDAASKDDTTRYALFLRQNGKSYRETYEILLAFSDVTSIVENCNDIDETLLDAKTSSHASRILSALLVEPKFTQMDRKRNGLCITAVQLYIRMLKEGEVHTDEVTAAPSAITTIASKSDVDEKQCTGVTRHAIEQPRVAEQPLTVKQSHVVEQPRTVEQPRVKEKPQANAVSTSVPIREKERTMVENDAPAEPVIAYLESKGIPYIDKRSQGGRFWMIGGMSLSQTVIELKEKSICFAYAPNGSKSTNGLKAWYMLFAYQQSKENTHNADVHANEDMYNRELVSNVKEGTPTTMDDLSGFRKWAASDGIAERTCYAYSSALIGAGRYKNEHSIGVHQLISDDAVETEAAIDELMSNDVFVSLNKAQHYRFLAAMRKYLLYLRNAQTDSKNASDSNTYSEANSVSYIRDTASYSDEIVRVDFDHPELCSMTKPVSCTILGRDINFQKRNWAQLLYAITEYFIKNGGTNTNHLNSTALYGSRMFFLNQKAELGTCIKLSNGKWLFVNYAPKTTVTIIGRLCRHYHVGLDDVIITYTKINDRSMPPPRFDLPPERQIKSPEDDSYLSFLKDYFPDGYVPGDYICQMRARAAYEERFGMDCQIDGTELDSAMRRIGTVKDGRVYASDNAEQELLREICEITTGILRTYTCVYASELFERYRERLTAVSIYSSDALMSAMSRLASGDFSKGYGYFMKAERNLDCAADCRVYMRANPGATTITKLREVLWFIPESVIKIALMNAGDCVWVSVGTYMLIEHFPMTREDADKIGVFIDSYLMNHAYLLLARLRDMLRDDTLGIASDMAQYAPSTISDVLRYYLRNRFGFTKVIVSGFGKEIDIPTLFADYGAEHPHFSLEELDAFATELGVNVYWEALYTNAVRISADEYVSDSEIRFNVPATDAVLEQICVGECLPIADINNAMMIHLPACGYNWNGYLLHSYIYKFSKLFKLVNRSMTKGKYTGAMVRRSSQIDSYMQLVERVLTDDKTWKTKDDALVLLTEHGYQTVMRLDGIEEIIKRIQKRNV